VKLPFDDWWDVLATHRFEPLADRLMLHPVSDPNMMAGNGTVGLEILEDAPDVDAIVVPYGGGGLSTGIASAVRALKPSTKVFAAEVDAAAPFAAALAAGEPTRIDYHPSFVDGIGSARVLDEMWPLARSILDGSLVVSVPQAAAAVRLLVERNRVVAEGAGAAGVAAVLDAKAGGGTVVCVVSGGNIDASKLTKILAGEVP
jgi:threonine dehydratase